MRGPFSWYDSSYIFVVRPAGDAKMPASEWAASVGLKPGDTFGN